MSRWKRRHLKSSRSLTVSSASRLHSGCVLHQGILLTPVPFVPWQSGLPFPRYNLTLKIQGQKEKVKGTPVSAASCWLISLCFPSGHPIDSRRFCSMTIRPPIPDIQFELENSRSKVKVKGIPVNAPSSWLISLVFQVRASYQLLSLSCHDNRASHS